MRSIVGQFFEIVFLIGSLICLLEASSLYNRNEFPQATYVLGMAILLWLMQAEHTIERKINNLEDRIKYERILRRGINGEQQDKE